MFFYCYIKSNNNFYNKKLFMKKVVYQIHQKKSSSKTEEINSKTGNFDEQSTPQKAGERLPSINPEAQSDIQKVYKDLISLNRNYLTEKTKITQVKKPNIHQHKMPSKTGTTQYSQRYQKNTYRRNTNDISQQIDPPGVRFYFPSTQITNLKSSYQNQFGVESPCKPAQEVSLSKRAKTTFFVDTGAVSKSTSYQQNFTHKDTSIDKGKKRLESIVVGGKLHGKSNYQDHFKSKQYLKTQPSRKVVQKGHKIFVGLDQFDNKKNENKNERRYKREQMIRPTPTISPYFQKFFEKSEYKKVYQQKQPEKDVQFNCLTADQLDRFIMNE